MIFWSSHLNQRFSIQPRAVLQQQALHREHILLTRMPGLLRVQHAPQPQPHGWLQIILQERRTVFQTATLHQLADRVHYIPHPGYQQSNRIRQRFPNLFGYLFGYLFDGRGFMDTQVSISELMPLSHQQIPQELFQVGKIAFNTGLSVAVIRTHQCIPKIP